MLFKSIYYDDYKNKIYFVGVDENNKIDRQTFSPNFEYYIEDRTGKSEIKDIYDIPVVKKISDTREGMRSVKESNVKTFETDISQDVKFLQEHYKGKHLEVDISKLNIGILDIEIQTDGSFPKPEQAKYPINLISIKISKLNEIYTFGTTQYTGNNSSVKNYHYCENEKLLLDTFVDFFRKQHLDIISGWNITQFDIPYLVKRMEILGIQKSLSPYDIVKEKRGYCEYIIAGIADLDYMKLFKKFTYTNKESYSLNFIANDILGEGKLEYEGQINDLWKRDWNKFVEYNINDVVLVDKIDNDPKKGMRLIELIVNIAYQCLIPFEKVHSSVAVHTGYILKYLKEHNMVMPDRQKKTETEALPGAYVYSKSGIYKHIISFDVESMYPHLLMMQNISPETLILNPTEEQKKNLIKTPVEGIYYRKDKKGVLSEITKKMFSERKALKEKMKICDMLLKKYSINDITKILKKDELIVKKYIEEIEVENGNKKYYDSQQQVRKIMLNSLYGVLGNEYFQFFNINNAKAITLGGQSLIKFLTDSVNDYFKNYFYKNKKYFGIFDENNKIQNDVVVLVDTDSAILTMQEVYEKLKLNFKDENEFLEYTKKFSTEFLEPFFEKILKIYANRYGVEQIINFKREKIATKILITTKKRYAIEVIDNEGIRQDPSKFVIKGLEIVRTDTPGYCRDKLKYILKEIFRTEDRNYIIEEMRKIKKEFKKKNIDEIASPTGVSDYDKYTKSMEYYLKNGISYEKSTPIHVRASLCYNYIIKKYNLNLMPVSNGTKIKWVYTTKNNELGTYVIGFVGNWPTKFNELFKVDYEIQWEKSFQTVISQFFEVLNWGDINLNIDKMSSFIS